MEQRALPPGIRRNRDNFVDLAEVYKQLNAPLGELGRASLVYANRSVTDVDKAYARYLGKIADITSQRTAWPEISSRCWTPRRSAISRSTKIRKMASVIAREH